MNIVHFAILALVGTSSLTLAACERREGPMERTGEKLDKTGEDLKDAGKEATEK